MERNLTFTAGKNAPYYDIFNAHDNILNILFKPGQNLNPEDLNLLQSHIQEQIAILGNHFLRNASFVSGGNYSLVTSNFAIYCFSKDLDITSISLKGSFFKDLNSDCFIKITSPKLPKSEIITPIFTENSKEYFIQTIERISGEFPKNLDSTFILWDEKNNIPDIKNIHLTIYSFYPVTFIHFEKGVLFLDGYFVYFNEQIKIFKPLSNFQQLYSYSIGFKVKKSIASASLDDTLKDNAFDSISFGNYGADRLKIEVFLDYIKLIEDENYFDVTVKDNFLEFLRLKKNIIIKDVRVPVFTEFEKTLARRTYDESGSYTVKPFKLEILSNNNNFDFTAKLSPGKAYIFGHELEKLDYTLIPFNKCYETISTDNNILKTQSGFYFELSGECIYFIDIANLEIISLLSEEDNILGTGRCYDIQQNNNTFKLFLCNIEFLNSSYNFDDVFNLKNDLDFNLGESILSFSGTPIDSLRFKLDKNIKNVSNIKFSGKKIKKNIIDNTIFIADNETFSPNILNYQVYNVGKIKLKLNSISLTSNSIKFNCNNNEQCFYAICNNVKFIAREFQRISKTVTLNIFSDENIIFNIPNDELDSLVEILYNNENIIKDFTIKFPEKTEFTIGGFDLLYSGFLKLIGNITIIYKKWEYSEIGEYLVTNNYLDFRNINSRPSEFNIDNNSEISYKKSQFTGRIDKIVLTKNLTFEIITGTYGITYSPPKDRSDAMTLYTLIIPANVLTPQGIGIKFHENKRYTMRDIGKLEKRIENLEYYTALNLLEKETSDQKFLDQDGNNRFKNGFLVDNFKTFKSVSLSDPECKFSLDTQKGHLRPSFKMVPIDAKFNSSSTCTLSNKLITLPFKEINYIDQTFASSVINVNFYETFTWEGKIVLSPENDFWVDTTAKPDVFLNNYGENDIYTKLGEKGFNAQWSSWESAILNSDELSEDKNLLKIEKKLWNPSVENFVADKTLIDNYNLWISSGFKAGLINKLTPDGYLNGKPSIFQDFKIPSSTIETAKEVNASKISTTSLGKKLANVSFASYMRAISIQFDVTCLKPLTQFYVIFDDFNVTNYCQLKGVTYYGNLVTNEFGELSGTFFLPANKFLVGSKIFKVVDSLDVDVGSFAISQFFSKGMLNETQESFLSTREAIAILPPASLNATIPKTLSNEEISIASQSKEYNISAATQILANSNVAFVDVKFKVNFTCAGSGVFNVLKDNNIILNSKNNDTVSCTIFINDLLTIDIFDSEAGLYESNSGLPFIKKPESRKYQSAFRVVTDMDIIITFIKPIITKVKVVIKDACEYFKDGIPFYNVKFDCLFPTVLSNNKEVKPVISRLRYGLGTNEYVPLPSKTPSTSLNPSITPTPTPTPAEYDFYATKSPTPTPTSSKTPAKSPTPTPTPTPENIIDINFYPEATIFKEPRLETIEISMVPGDSIQVDYFRRNTPTLNFCDVNPPEVTWNTLTENSASFILTKEVALKYSSLNLFLTPLEKNILQIKIKNSGYPLNLKWLITNFGSTKISYSGNISVPANGVYINFPELLDTPINECNYLRLIPTDAYTLERINTQAIMFYDNGGRNPTNGGFSLAFGSPFSINNFVFKNEISHILKDDFGIRLKAITSDERNYEQLTSVGFPTYNANSNSKIKTCFIELKTFDLNASPTPSPSPGIVIPSPTPSISLTPTPTPTPNLQNVILDKDNPTSLFYNNVIIDSKVDVTIQDIVERPQASNLSGKIEFSSIKISPKIPAYPDALAQSFFIDKLLYPEGVFLSSIDLYFKTKDNTIPVSLELRPSVNSYPSSKIVIPFSRVTKPAQYINISENATIPTNFKFSDPVYLKPGEYNFVIYSDSLMYKSWIAKLGEFKVGSSSERILKNPYAGSLFKSSNGTAWLPDMESDFTFKINRCSFTSFLSNCIIENTLYDSKEFYKTNLEFSTIRTNAITIIPENTFIKTSEINLIKKSGVKEIPLFLDLNISKEYDTTYIVKDLEPIPSITSNIILCSNKENVSPIIDTERLSYILVINEINKLLTLEDEQNELIPNLGKAKARYITNQVQLNLDILASKLNVSFAAACKKGTQIRVYYKILNSILDRREFFPIKKWVEIGKVTKVSKDSETFIDFSFESPSPIIYDGNSQITDFDLFSIKLVLESESNNVPLVKDFRVVALSD